MIYYVVEILQSGNPRGKSVSVGLFVALLAGVTAVGLLASHFLSGRPKARLILFRLLPRMLLNTLFPFV